MCCQNVDLGIFGSKVNWHISTKLFRNFEYILKYNSNLTI